MDRLVLFLTCLSAAAIAGAMIAVSVASGYTSIWAILICIILAISIAYPSAKLVARNVYGWQERKETDRHRSTDTDSSD